MTDARPLLVFDGDCGFCTASARFAERRLRLEHVEPWQALDLADLGLDEASCSTAVQWVAIDGAVVAAERAVSAALVHAGWPWRPLGRLLVLPGIRPVAGLVYRWVARHRHRLPGATDACRVGSPRS
ncbi:MAG: thiol-disulfide oxidoreductase DCC family protein [Ilumatobacteraceae bacterium]